MRYVLRAFLLCNLDMPLRDYRPCKRGAEHICSLIDRIGLEGRVDIVSDKRLLEIFYIYLRSASCISLLLDGLVVLVLSYISNICDYIESLICKPLEDNRGIQTARVCKYDFIFHLFIS